ncbi:DUF6504 family protein [Salinactinospora qingdaonensis]|uniref:DUF6504 domain-containing protein n=1 Tax=Salinactinospora qingdaonensis TaxID=702744 RepID=A0ABP7EUF1_9ACTN
MSRSYGAPITVGQQQGRPVRFTWEGRIYTVHRIIDHWVALRSQWSPESQERAPRRRCWRVQAGVGSSYGVYELYHDLALDEWRVARVALPRSPHPC